mmetsp:Transcript_15065/g.33211  ORF Transcript_15065/g.33211 Transcript_15065/m.33211 type:complete len:248 (+) Transcript_15065:1070-1813(+)
MLVRQRVHLRHVCLPHLLRVLLRLSSALHLGSELLRLAPQLVHLLDQVVSLYSQVRVLASQGAQHGLLRLQHYLVRLAYLVNLSHHLHDAILCYLQSLSQGRLSIVVVELGGVFFAPAELRGGVVQLVLVFLLLLLAEPAAREDLDGVVLFALGFLLLHDLLHRSVQLVLHPRTRLLLLVQDEHQPPHVFLVHPLAAVLRPLILPLALRHYLGCGRRGHRVERLQCELRVHVPIHHVVCLCRGRGRG